MAFTEQQEIDLLALLEQQAIEPSDLVRAYDLDDANLVDDFIFNVDATSYTEARKAKRSQLVRLGVMEDIDGQDLQKFVTANAFKATLASASRLGVLKLASEAQIIAGTNAVNGVTPEGLTIRENEKFKKSKSYLLSNFDLTASNVSAITVVAFSEMVVGNYTDMGGLLSVTTTTEVPNLEIVLNATQTPYHVKAGSAAFFDPNTRLNGLACSIGTDGGKLKIIVGLSDDNSFPAGTYEISLAFTYYSA